MSAVHHEKSLEGIHGIHQGKETSSSNELDRSSDFENDAGGVDAGDMYRMGKEQQFRVSIAKEFML
jgi:hypothetical protein